MIKFSVMTLSFLIASASYAESLNGNMCTIAAFQIDTDKNFAGRTVTRKHLGTSSAINIDGVASTAGKIFSISKKRALIFRGVIGMDGYFRIQIEESDQTNKGIVSYKNSKVLVPETTYYSPYSDDGSENKAKVWVLEKYIVTISCSLFTY